MLMFVRGDSGRAGGSALRHITYCAAIDCRNLSGIKAMIVVHHLNESGSQRILWPLEELQAPYEVAFY